MLPTVKLGDTDITRLIVGGNPFSGNSHVSRELDIEMENFYTADKIKEVLFRCQEQGINAMQLRADRHIMRIIREFRNEGGKLNWIAMNAAELSSFENNVKAAADAGAVAVYHHGSFTDMFFKDKNYDEIRRRIDIIKKAGLPAGIGTHMPPVIEYAEEHDWGADFYMTCVYNIMRYDRQSSTVTGKANEGEPFFEEDIPLMYEAVRKTKKPCIAFKIFAGGQIFAGKKESDYKEIALAMLKEVYANIKPNDIAALGVFQRDGDLLAEDVELANKVL